MDELGTLFTLSNLPGHFSYSLIAISYWLTDIFWLRVVAVVGLVKDRLSLRLPEGDRELLRSVLTGLDDSQIARLLHAGAFVDLADGTRLAEENEALKRMLFICSGRARVTIGGREVSRLEKGSFVGEVAFLTDTPATATVIADGDMRAIAFDSGTLRRFFDKETEVAGLIYQLLGRELAGKIRVSNTLLAVAGA